MRWPSGLIVLALAAATAGCGAAHPRRAANGQSVFVRACGACHTLSGVDSPSRQGGDLLDVRLTRPVMLQFAREMPVRHPLTVAQLRAVTGYILAVQRRHTFSSR